MKYKPKIVCLCGSTRFKNEFIEINKSETLKGNIVLSVGLFGHADNIELSEQQKEMLDELHKRKIDLADEVIILNINNYIGKSTKGEIEYAIKIKKPIKYLEKNNNDRNST